MSTARKCGAVAGRAAGHSIIMRCLRMSKKIAEIQNSIAKALNGLPNVFSTVQWGGRAYKLPGPNGSMKKPRLLAHVWLGDDGNHVSLSFKLKKQRAAVVVDEFEWIQPHSFRTLAPSGWITAIVNQKFQARIVIGLLTECHRDLAPAKNAEESAAAKRRRGTPTGGDETARRIDLVLNRKREEGWKPASTDSFDH